MSKNKDISNPSESQDLNPNTDGDLTWQIALENSNIGVWDWNAISNKVFYSKESKKMLGFEDHEIQSVSEEWDNRVHPEDRQQYFEDFNNHINGLKPHYSNEHRIQCKDGTYKWILDIGKVIDWDHDGKPKRIIGTHTDITERKEHMQALSTSISLISNQNTKLNNFAHIVTHNLKSHSGNLESLLSFYDETDNVQEKQVLIEHLKTVSDSLSKTIYNLNQIVSIQTNKDDHLETLNIDHYIKNSIKVLEIEIKNTKARINNKVDKTIYIEYIPAYLESIFQNLISNSIKYKHPDRKPVIDISSSESETDIIITIKDNGLGIDMNKFGKDIFGLYKTFHRNKNSEGVGLYLVKNQIESQNGKIEIDSELNKGTIFTISFRKTKNPA